MCVFESPILAWLNALHDQLNANNTNIKKGWLSYDITTDVYVKYLVAFVYQTGSACAFKLQLVRIMLEETSMTLWADFSKLV